MYFKKIFSICSVVFVLCGCGDYERVEDGINIFKKGNSIGAYVEEGELAKVGEIHINARNIERPVNSLRLLKIKGDKDAYGIFATNYLVEDCRKTKVTKEPCGFAYIMMFQNKEGIKTFLRGLKKAAVSTEIELDVSYQAYSETDMSTKVNDEMDLMLSYFHTQGYLIISGQPLYNRHEARTASFVFKSADVSKIHLLLEKMLQKITA